MQILNTRAGDGLCVCVCVWGVRLGKLMLQGDFFGSERSVTLESDTDAGSRVCQRPGRGEQKTFPCLVQVKIVFESDSGSTTTLKALVNRRLFCLHILQLRSLLGAQEKLSLVKGEILDAAAMSTVKLREYLEKDLFLEPSQLHLTTVPPVLSDEEINDAKAKDVMLSLHLKATMMKAWSFERALQ